MVAGLELSAPSKWGWFWTVGGELLHLGGRKPSQLSSLQLWALYVSCGAALLHVNECFWCTHHLHVPRVGLGQ